MSQSGPITNNSATMTNDQVPSPTTSSESQNPTREQGDEGHKGDGLGPGEKGKEKVSTNSGSSTTTETSTTSDKGKTSTTTVQSYKSFSNSVELLRISSLNEWRPFWPIISGLLVALDILISIIIIILSAVTASFAGSGPDVIRALAITSTVIAGVAAMLKGTGLPTTAYLCERALYRFYLDVETLQTECTHCAPPGAYYRFGGWFSAMGVRQRKQDSAATAVAEDRAKSGHETAEEHQTHVERLTKLKVRRGELLTQVEGVGSQAFSAFGWGTQPPTKKN